MTSNREKAAEIIAPWIEKEWGHPEDNAESAADALAAEGALADDLPAPSFLRPQPTHRAYEDMIRFITGEEDG